MDLSSLSLLLLVLGQNTLPPKRPRAGTKCPHIEIQSNFDMNKIMNNTYYFNYGLAKGDTLERFKCIKMKLEHKYDGTYLHLSGVKHNEKREQAWHKLKRNEGEKHGHYEIDFRTNNTNHESEAFLYYHPENPEARLFIVTCVRFPIIRKHSVGGIIGSNKPTLDKAKLTKDLKWLRKESKLTISKKGSKVNNNCGLATHDVFSLPQEAEPKFPPFPPFPGPPPPAHPPHVPHVPHQEPHHHSHHHHHSHPHPQGNP